jgi:hypothetical protein
MIVYQSGTRFFPMKADAERHAREEGRKASEVCKMVINDRDELALALNTLSYIVHQGIAPIEAAPVPIRETGEDDWVPSFIQADWERRRKARQHKGE